MKKGKMCVFGRAYECGECGQKTCTFLVYWYEKSREIIFMDEMCMNPDCDYSRNLVNIK